MRAAVPALDPPSRLLMGSGPSNPETRVLRALATPPVAADDPAHAALLHDVTVLLRRAFRTSTNAALVVPGASRAGIEAVLASVIEPGDRVLVGVYGHFGELLCGLAARHGAVVERIDAEWGSIVDPEQVVATLRRAPPKAVAIVHADTSTGMLQPLEAIGRACHDSGSLLLVDAVLSLGGCELRVDDWCLDAAMGGAQKCLGGPPGLAPLTYSDRLAHVLATRRTPPRTSYLDLRRYAVVWQGSSRSASSVCSTSMVFGLREALRIIDEEGLEARWERHRRAQFALVAGIQALGLEIFGDRQFAAPMITLVRVPDGIGEADVRQQLLHEHGVEVMAAFGALRGRVWRIGSMGTNARLPSVLRVLAALEAVLSARGCRAPRGAAVDAAVHAHAAWR